MIKIENLPCNEEMNSDGMSAIGGGISFPSVLHGAPIKLIAPPQSSFASQQSRIGVL